MIHPQSRLLLSIPWIIGGLALGLLVVAASLQGGSTQHAPFMEDLSQRRLASDDRGTDVRYSTTIRRPSGPPVMQLQQPDPAGRVGTVACSTCHSIRDPNYANRSPADLDQFHQDMPLSHGGLACYACHNPDDADALRLADGTSVSYPDVMTLCAQCHGTQARDYERGAHGGMSGYWDLSRGPRFRNNCVDCHDPHSPAFPSMQPTFKPRDRFLTAPTPHAGEATQQTLINEASGE